MILAFPISDFFTDRTNLPDYVCVLVILTQINQAIVYVCCKISHVYCPMCICKLDYKFDPVWLIIGIECGRCYVIKCNHR